MQLNQTSYSQIDKKFVRNFWVILLFLFIVRIIAIYIIPLNDSTEARYGEIARIMLETHNWITPMQEYGIPFWAKPPLSFWMSALSMKLFGVNEFAARFPSLILSLGILFLVWHTAKLRLGQKGASLSVLILASCVLFFLDAGAIMTDPALLFCTTLIILSFWQAVIYNNKFYSYSFFIGIGLGLLAKGPIAIVLTGLPIFLWALIHNKWRNIWGNLPWFRGVIITLLIALPWYILAEIKTPGFLNYFILGEHFGRFLNSGWVGDKYGFAHNTPLGFIWLYMSIGFMPWTILAVIWSIKYRKKLPNLLYDDNGWISYLFLCSTMPLVFFTFARNIIYPYVLPVLPSMALLFAELIVKADVNSPSKLRIIPLSCLSGLIFIIASILFIYKPAVVEQSQKRVVQIYNENASSNSKLIYWSPKVDFSASFYSKGKALATAKENELYALLDNHEHNLLVVESKYFKTIPEYISSKMHRLAIIENENKSFEIYLFCTIHHNQPLCGRPR